MDSPPAIDDGIVRGIFGDDSIHGFVRGLFTGFNSRLFSALGSFEGALVDGR